MDKQNQQTNISESNQEKPKNFWQKLKLWQKVGVVIIVGMIIMCGGYLIANLSKIPNNKIVKINIEYKHRICESDEDCIHIMIECSCDCGDAVNKKFQNYFINLLNTKCKDYTGKMCKILCSYSQPKCVDNTCQLIEEIDNNIEEVILTADKTEYQTGEDVKLTIENNLEEGVFLAKNSCHSNLNPHPILQKYEEDKWLDYQWRPYPLPKYLCEQDIFVCDEIKNAKEIKLLLQGKDFDILLLAGKYRIGLIFGKSCNDQKSISDNDYGLSDKFVVYSNEFTIKSDLAEVEMIGGKVSRNICNIDLDCKWVGCGCLNKDYAKTARKSIENPEICSIISNVANQSCVCFNNKCVDINSLGHEVLSTEDEIQSLIQQMGDKNISQEVKNAIPEKFYDYGKEAIPYLIEALEDERVFNDCYVGSSGMLRSPGDECDQQRLVGSECMVIIKSIITPNPYPKTAPTDKGYRFSYKVNAWQQWWNENQDKSLNEIRKMVRDYYRSKEEKNNYSGVGYRGEEYDYLDFVGDLSHDDWDWDTDQECHGLSEVKQCDYLDWPISYGCRVADKYKCYNCVVSINGDVSACEKIILENKTTEDFYKNGCYYRAATALDKKGMNDKIDFCDKFSGEWEESYKEKCLKLAK